MGAAPIFTKATEPTNIIWENRHIRGVNFCARALSALLIILFMLSITFTAIFLGKRYQIHSAQNFPPVNCADFAAHLAPGTELEALAGLEYIQQ